MKKKIQYYIKNVYGNDHVYIAQHFSDMEEIADAVTQLTGKKTISSGDMTALRSLGFTFEQVLAP